MHIQLFQPVLWTPLWNLTMIPGLPARALKLASCIIDLHIAGDFPTKERNSRTNEFRTNKKQVHTIGKQTNYDIEQRRDQSEKQNKQKRMTFLSNLSKMTWFCLYNILTPVYNQQLPAESVHARIRTFSSVKFVHRITTFTKKRPPFVLLTSIPPYFCSLWQSFCTHHQSIFSLHTNDYKTSS